MHTTSLHVSCGQASLLVTLYGVAAECHYTLMRVYKEPLSAVCRAALHEADNGERRAGVQTVACNTRTPSTWQHSIKGAEYTPRSETAVSEQAVKTALSPGQRLARICTHYALQLRDMCDHKMNTTPYMEPGAKADGRGRHM